MDQILDGLARFSAQLGTGNVAFDLTIVAAILAGLFFLAAVLAWGLTRKPEGGEARIDRLDTLLGRLERTERTLHEFRTDVLRTLEMSRTDLEFLRGEVETVRALLEQDAAAFKTRERRPSREELASRLQRLPGFVPPHEAPDRNDTVLNINTAAPLREEQASAPRSSGGLGVNLEARGSATVPSSGARPTRTLEEPIPSSGGRATAPLAQRLEKTRKSFFERFRGVFSTRPKIDAEAIDELEAILVGSDLGLKNIRELLSEVRKDIAEGAELSEGGVKAIVKSKLLSLLERGSPISGIPTPRRNDDGPMVILMVGVNGAGKTTTAAKLAGRFKQEGANPLLVAADTFRAAAVEQLHEWGRRLGVEVVSGAENAKPQTVVFDAMQRAMNGNVDCVIIDTAGRLHTKQSLMDELTGIRNSIEKHVPGGPHEVLLVIDGSTGQNGLNQAREFNASSGITGLVITKLDGTSKGGILVAIKDELGIPVRYIGTGERAEDLEPFSPREFVEAIFSA